MSLNKEKVVLVPAAGFGRRVGSPESKEMLMRVGGQPLIEMPLALAAECGARAHVVSRKEKRSLNMYLESDGARINPALSVQLVGATKEWPETLLLSEPHWGDCNVVCLPDTEFLPLNVLDKLFAALTIDADLVFATFSAKDYQTWGVVDVIAGSHCEKPTEWSLGSRAWGLFGFKKQFGRALLEQMLSSTFDHTWRSLKCKVTDIPLDHFKDLTRG